MHKKIPCTDHLCKGRINSAVPPIFLSKTLRHSTCLTRIHGLNYYHFIQTAPVGNSSLHLNLRKLSAGDFLSLIENDALLCTFIAFVICMYDTRFIVNCQEKSYLLGNRCRISGYHIILQLI